MLDALWTSLQVGSVRVSNRVFTTGHALLYGEQGVLSDRHVDYYRERARGGVGLIVTEQQAAHPSGRNYHRGCAAYLDRAVAQFAKLAAAVHPHDTKVLAQLFCGGAQGSGTMYIDDWRPLLAPSTIASTQFQELPAAMEQADIDDVVKGFARSARNAIDGGLDGIEIHAAHSQLLGAFLSPAWNRRSDAYGGSLENRCRIVLEIGEAIRAACGDAIALGLRLSVSEYLSGHAGITEEQTERQVALFAASGLFDFYDISAGGYYAKHVSVTPMLSDLPEGFLAPAARRLRSELDGRARVLMVGRVLTLELAARLIAEGAADMVAMTRAHVADPHLVRKARSGRGDETVRCVGANVCIRRLGENNHVACLVNPGVGRESSLGHGTLSPVAADARKRITIIGGGPAGMKAAGVAAMRGHAVTLIEQDLSLGGHLRRMARLPGRGRWQHAIDDLASPLARVGVEITLGRSATPEMLGAMDADIVVCATGASFACSGYSPSRPDRPGIAGADAPNVLDIASAIDRVLLAPDGLGGSVIILDEGNDVLTAGLAELLADAGTQVRIVTPYLHFGDGLARTYELPIVMRRLAHLGVAVMAQSFVESISGAVVHLVGSWSGVTTVIDGVDTIVLAQARQPIAGLYRQLRGVAGDVRCIGDALAPRSIEAVIYEGEKLARQL